MMEICIRRKWHAVANLLEASELWMRIRNELCFGASAMVRDDGNVRVGKRTKYRVSYNGRVWAGQNFHIAIDPTKLDEFTK